MNKIVVLAKYYFAKILPYPIRWFLRFVLRGPALCRDYMYDFKRYVKWSSVISSEYSREKTLAIITATYHNIEKGLSLPNPRPQFGKYVIANLIEMINYYHLNFGPDKALNVPISVLSKYCEFNNQAGFKNPELETIIKKLLINNQLISDEAGVCGGVEIRTAEQIKNVVSAVNEDFFHLRHSIRQFSSEPIAAHTIETAVRIAQKSPAVCNRQSGKVRAILKKQDISDVLKIQGGARGFYEEVQALFCISVDLSNFNGAERYQGWIDGGMFAMSFIYGLHTQGLGSCALNWSKTSLQDKEMRKHLSIPENEVIIMFVAAGHLRESFMVAKSSRKYIEDVLHYY